ncbi:hypothetical protein DPMN_182883 [Dreissena polymorpha]|uniref:Uncharacterized protein n=1 Tax=Dreissena polymorpha TaxID=45954 RepID=A0A9D4DGI6_DREPO|nr:hypothetical protein DPMN_182883 [Dreissena polymorpha]
MLSPPVSFQTRFNQLIGTVALVDARKFQQPIDYRPIRKRRKPPLRRCLPVAFAESARCVRRDVRGPRP